MNNPSSSETGTPVPNDSEVTWEDLDMERFPEKFVGYRGLAKYSGESPSSGHFRLFDRLNTLVIYNLQAELTYCGKLHEEEERRARHPDTGDIHNGDFGIETRPSEPQFFAEFRTG
ncbi:hypothetical protein BDW74DRAFT_175453 [Aspergillus multicolor]|uniref:uncharacterized protein n=1 Tax=Aspergillus multicolor TaxID=41759 RepID=UPI003CCDDA85